MNQLLNKKCQVTSDFATYDIYQSKSLAQTKNQNTDKKSTNDILISKNDANISEDISIDHINDYLKLINDSLNMLMLTAILESKVKNKILN